MLGKAKQCSFDLAGDITFTEKIPTIKIHCSRMGKCYKEVDCVDHTQRNAHNTAWHFPEHGAQPDDDTQNVAQTSPNENQ